LSTLEGGRDGIFIADGATGGVDEISTLRTFSDIIKHDTGTITDLFETFEKVSINESPGSLVQRAVHSDNITLSKF
jgi:hypothetical protein